VGRVPRITVAYVDSLNGLGVMPGSPRARAIAATVRQIVEAPELPLPGDLEGPLPRKTAVRVEQSERRRLLTAFARRVTGQRVWVWYRPRAAGLVDLVAVTSAPPP
jgi:hypothetical protein